MTFPPALTYFLQATYESNLGGPMAGYAPGPGFGQSLNGFHNTYLCDILSDLVDTSYMFVGGAYVLGSNVFPRSTFNLRYSTSGTYTPPFSDNTTGEVPGTPVALPNEEHTWTVKFRWRVVGGLPDGRSASDIALNLRIDHLAGASNQFITRTYADSAPVFRTDTVTLHNPSGGGTTSPQFGTVQASLGTNKMRDEAINYLTNTDGTLVQPPVAVSNDPSFNGGPNYLPVQLAWVSVTGPNPIKTVYRSRAGSGRAFFV
jgi:hypothetical protein